MASQGPEDFFRWKYKWIHYWC